jgi:hypothetical protein
MSDKHELGQICYDAYCKSMGNAGFNKFPIWELLSDDNQLAWQLAAKAVITYTS